MTPTPRASPTFGRWIRRFGPGLVPGVVLGLVLGASAAHATPETESPYRNLGIFARVLAHIEMSWIEEIDQQEAVYGAIRGMVESLDPHSTYMDPEEYRILTSDTQGRFGGIGGEIEVQDGWLTVLGVFDGGPADRAGLQPGDRFLTIQGRSARDLPIGDAVQLMRGEAGTDVQVGIRRDGEDDAIEVTLTREIIRVEAVEARVLPDRIAYIHIKSFQQTTTRELRRALDIAVDETRAGGGLRGVILDLRNNPGGLLDEAVLVSDEFLSRGTIVSTRGRGDRVLSEARASSSGTRPDWPMVVLVNGYSASAAEIVAGALQDHGRAVVVGTRTFGKGSVQNIIELPDGSGLKLTIARYFTPSGRSIQAEGVAPDMEIEQIREEALREGIQREVISEALLEGHLDERVTMEAVEVSRDAPRETVDGEEEAPFADDYQARMAHQALRAIVTAQGGSE
ncbi:MAG: S41 family peptidase [Myxococcota bacterium]